MRLKPGIDNFMTNFRIGLVEEKLKPVSAIVSWSAIYPVFMCLYKADWEWKVAMHWSKTDYIPTKLICCLS